jgi:FtsZ-interacting cell division protein ZipA
MSSLQLGLIVAGVLLVVAVIVYNVWQERRLKRTLAPSARAPADRSATNAMPRASERVEPTLGVHRAAASATTAEGMPAHRPGAAHESSFEPPVDVIARPGSFDTADETFAGTSQADVTGGSADERFGVPAAPIGDVPEAASMQNRSASRQMPQPDHEIECLIPLQPATPITAGALAVALHARIGKRLRWFGRPDVRSDWERIGSDTPGRFADIVGCMLLADRNGAASRAQLDTFVRIAGEIASSVGAAFTPPEVEREVARAEALDRLCAELDVQIGLTLQMPEGASIAGTRLRGVAEASGFRLSPAGRFEFTQEDTGAVVYTLQNLRPDPFSAEMLRLTATNGVVFLLDVARLADPARVFDQMKLAARRMAATLGAELVDDNRRRLDDAALAAIREQVEAAADALRAVHIEPGSSRALALFSA